MGFTHSGVRSSAAAYITGTNPICAMPETAAVMLVIRLKCSMHIMKYTKAKMKLDALNGIAKIMTSEHPFQLTLSSIGK